MADQNNAPEGSPETLIDLIGELGREVYYMLDDCETSGLVGDEIHTITSESLEKVSGILDRIDALPFEEPGCILGTGAKLQVALKQTLDLARADRAAPTDSTVLVDVAASLAAAISLLERGGKSAKKAAASDKMFDQMLADYRASLERARAALSPETDGGRDG